MKFVKNLAAPALASLTLLAAAQAAHAAYIAPITGWAVHNGASTVGGTPAAPTFTPADDITILAPFEPITLTADGDFVRVSTVLTISQRTGNTGANGLNTQLRAGIFNGPAGAVALHDVPHTGFTIEYSNLDAGGLIGWQTSMSETNPFMSLTPIGNGVKTVSDSIRTANPGPVYFYFTLIRDGANIDLDGEISASDPITGNPYNSQFRVNGIPVASYSFNRFGLFLGPNVDGTSAVVTNSTVATNVPEPSVALWLGLIPLVGCLKRLNAA